MSSEDLSSALQRGSLNVDVLCRAEKRGRGGGAGHDRSRPSYLAQQFVVIFEETASGSHEDSSFCFPCLFNTLARGTPDPGPR